MRFLIHYFRGPNWKDGLYTGQQPFIRHHAVYIQQLFDQGKVLLAGPFADGMGGACIIDVKDEEEARHIVENDPAVVQQTLTADWHPWRSIFDGIIGTSPNYPPEHATSE